MWSKVYFIYYVINARSANTNKWEKCCNSWGNYLMFGACLILGKDYIRVGAVSLLAIVYFWGYPTNSISYSWSKSGKNGECKLLPSNRCALWEFVKYTQGWMYTIFWGRSAKNAGGLHSSCLSPFYIMPWSTYYNCEGCTHQLSHTKENVETKNNLMHFSCFYCQIN
jgi:hypothetical protein